MPANKNCQGLVFFRSFSKIILTNNFETIYHNAILIETCVEQYFRNKAKLTSNYNSLTNWVFIIIVSMRLRLQLMIFVTFYRKKNLNIPNNCNKTLQLHRLKDEAWVLWNLACINPPFVHLTASSYCSKNSQLIQMLLFLSLNISLD